MSEQDIAGHRINPRDARLRAGMTQTQAAGMIGAALRTFQDWESGARNMPPAKYALFVILTGYDGKQKLSEVQK